MTVAQLIEELAKMPPHLQVELATCPRADEWYEVSDVVLTDNQRGDLVAVINSD